MKGTELNLNDWLRPLIREVIKEVLAEVGQVPTAPQHYGIEEAAKRLNVPKRWLYEKTSQQAIPFHKVGKYLRFTDADLVAISEKTSGRQPDAAK